MTFNYLFVVNPNAGTKSKDSIIQLIDILFDCKYNYKIIYWTNADEDIIAKIQKELSEDIKTIVVAIGGDGTVNMVSKSIEGTQHVLGIIPIGSGNGLARHLQIPMNYIKAVDFIFEKKWRIEAIDTCEVNSKSFFCTSGVGFDAHIGSLFAKNKSRGLKTYTKMVIKEFFSYKKQGYQIKLSDKTIDRSAFLITVANANQYGNNVFISPMSKINDGLMNVVVIRKVNIFNVIPLAIRLFNKTIHKSKHVETYLTSNLEIVRETSGAIHYDGEPTIDGENLIYSIKKKNLNVLVKRRIKSI
ncbi:MAG: hypothetical protein A2X12_07605 [Bacteroidetes bacterium GWE2_29_8]|nr:MAG: hypothetical protein A2X12_07605 [Bacteroidetes bacterium GWE2_29_8]OFY22739.1 MAG: hypothetical protein A2X02_02180 [Bacteroidetes bacterium GWF2_29_10]